MDNLEKETQELNRFLNSIWGFSIRNFRVTIIFIIAVIILGVKSLVTLPREAEPEVKIGVAVVTTVYPGANPLDVEKLVTDEIEVKLDELDNLDEITSTSSLGISSIVIKFDPKAPLVESIRKVKDKVDEAKSSLPSDALSPVITEVSLSDLPIAVFSLIGNLSNKEFKEYSKLAQKELESIKGVSEAKILGLRDEEIKVNIDKAKLEGYSISLRDVISAVKSNHINMPIGAIEVNDSVYELRLEGEYRKAADLKNIPVAVIEEKNIFLKDIAEILDAYEKENVISSFSSRGGLPKKTVALALYKKTGGNILKIVDEAKEKLEILKRKKFKKGVDIEITNDNSEFIREDFITLGVNGIESAIIIFVILFMALAVKEALIAALSIPFAFLITFTVIQLLGGTLNSLVLFSLVLSLGIMVDASIVIVEGIHANMITGKYTPRESALLAVKTYRYPVIAGTLTTVAAFVPMLLVSGIMGEFMKHIPITISVTLLSALLTSFTIIPAVSANIFRKISKLQETKKRHMVFDFIEKKYALLLKNILENQKRRKLVIILSIVFFLESLALPILGMLDVQMFPPVDTNYFIVNITALEGTKLKKTEVITNKVVEILMKNPFVDNFVGSTGGGSLAQTPHAVLGGGGSSANSNTAAITVNLIKKEKRNVKSYKIVENLRKEFDKIKEADVKIEELKAGPPSGAAIEIRVKGDDLNELEKISLNIKTFLAGIDGVRDIEDDAQRGAGEFVFKLKKDRLAYFGLSTETVASTLRNAVFGIDVVKVKRGDANVDIRIKYDWGKDERPNSVSEIENIEMPLREGSSISLKEIADIAFLPSFTAINHKDRTRIIRVSANTEILSAAQVFKIMEEKLKNYSLPENYNIEMGGEREDISESFSDLFNSLIVAVILIAIILVLEFNSFSQALIILFTLPLSLIGVFNGLFITRMPLSFPTFIGIVALAGIVVNEAIVIIDLINSKRKNGTPMEEAVMEICPSRIKPVFMTTTTTIGGILTLVFTNELWSGLGLAIIYGLLFSTILTFIVVPVMYLLLESFSI